MSLVIHDGGAWSRAEPLSGLQVVLTLAQVHLDALGGSHVLEGLSHEPLCQRCLARPMVTDNHQSERQGFVYYMY